MYRAESGIMHIEEDVFEKGCVGKSIDHFQNHEFEQPTIPLLLLELANVLEVSPKDLTLNASDEIGRVDVQRLDVFGGGKAGNIQIELWKRGELKLFLTTFTYYITESVPVDLSTFKPEEKPCNTTPTEMAE